MSAHTHTVAHPECAQLYDAGHECSCDDAYGFEAGGLDRAIEVALRMDGRTCQPKRGGGAPTDDNATEGGDVKLGGTKKAIVVSKPDGHFWKRSEHLKCLRGDPMVELDTAPMNEGNWAKASEVLS